MSVKKIPVPFCDWCGLPFLPKMLLKDGTQNPIFDHPEKSKRCGKCKRTGWNAGGVDRRRKKPTAVEFFDSVDSDPTGEEIAEACEEQTAQLDVDLIIEHPRTQIMVENLPMPVVPASSAPGARRCRHGLYKCQQCHPETAA